MEWNNPIQSVTLVSVIWVNAVSWHIVVVHFLIILANNQWDMQISKDGHSFTDVSRFSILVDMIIEECENEDGSDVKNDNNGRKPIVIPLTSIKSPVLARIMRYLEHYKQEPSGFAMWFGLSCYSTCESLEFFLTIKVILSSANNQHPLYIFKNRRYCSGHICTNGGCRPDTLFQMRAGADYLFIKPLLEVTSLAILIGHIRVSVFYVRFLMELWHA